MLNPMPAHRLLVLLACAVSVGVIGCSDASSTAPSAATPVTNTDPITITQTVGAQAATAGLPFRFDASQGNSAFSDPRKTGLTYTISGLAGVAGLSATGALISGTAMEPGVYPLSITARDASGQSATQSFALVVFAPNLTAPTLPNAPFGYSDASSPLPRHYLNDRATTAADNTPAGNVTTDAGATLGRVLFYDRRLSANDRVACASCHVQALAFSDSARLSGGFAGALTGRHSMALANARWYQPGRFFWDERAASLEAQVLQPIQDVGEMGMTLPNAITKLQLAGYYGPLFTAAFGSSDITSERVGRALAQFVRSLVSVGSKFDQAFANGPTPNFAAVFSPAELQGQNLFTGRAGCDRCHGTNAHVGDAAHNTGLDATITDAGAGNGRFKTPSLRNVEVRAPYMHDGRFRTLEQVVDFYNNGVQNNPGLDQRLRERGGQPQRLNLSAEERAALVAFLKTLTDRTFLTAPRFANPFPAPAGGPR